MVKVEIGISAEEGSDPNCRLPLTSYYTQLYARNVQVKPVCALLHKIDPTKPFGRFKLTVDAKRGKTSFSNIGRGTGNLGANMGVYTSSGIGGRTGIDPTQQSHFRDVVSQIRNNLG